MRCLIAVHQEYYPENSLKRAREVCDECLILYIVDRKVLERVREESSYVLPSTAIEEMEKLALELQRKEAEKIAEEHCGELNFVVDEYYSAIEREVLRYNPDLLMTDFWHRRYVSYGVPVWIDRGGEIRHMGFYVGDVSHLKSVKKSVEFLKALAGRIGAEFCVVPKDEEIARVLGEGKCSASPDAIAVQRKFVSSYKDWRGTLILL